MMKRSSAGLPSSNTASPALQQGVTQACVRAGAHCSAAAWPQAPRLISPQQAPVPMAEHCQPGLPQLLLGSEVLQLSGRGGMVQRAVPQDTARQLQVCFQHLARAGAAGWDEGQGARAGGASPAAGLCACLPQLQAAGHQHGPPTCARDMQVAGGAQRPCAMATARYRSSQCWQAESMLGNQTTQPGERGGRRIEGRPAEGGREADDR